MFDHEKRAEVLKAIKDNDIKYVDLRFTDIRGKWAACHLRSEHDRRGHLLRRHDVRRLFDRRLEGDQRVRHDPDARPDDGGDGPFFAAPTLSVVCDVLEPSTGEPYSRDPRGIARKAEAYAAAAGIGDAAYFGPEAEFFVFDDVRFSSIPTIPASCSIRPSCRRTRIRPTRGATSATASAQRAAISRCRRRTRRRTCAARCWRRWRRWAPRSRNTTTRWPPPSTSSA